MAEDLIEEKRETSNTTSLKQDYFLTSFYTQMFIAQICAELIPINRVLCSRDASLKKTIPEQNEENN